MAANAEMIAGAQAIQNSIGVPASVVLAQYYLESGDRPNKTGLPSVLASDYNNYFGIKGTGTAGSVKLPTTEHGSGGAYTTAATFAAYKTPADGVAAYAKTIANRYISPYLEGAVTVEDYVQGIHNSPYATDTNYDDKLNTIIKQYNLTQYDTNYKAFDKSGLNNITVSDGYTIPNTTTETTEKVGWFDNLTNKDWIVDNVAEPLTTVVFMILFAALAVVFFLRAFPATTGAVETVKSYTGKRKKKQG